MSVAGSINAKIVDFAKEVVTGQKNILDGMKAAVQADNNGSDVGGNSAETDPLKQDGINIAKLTDWGIKSDTLTTGMGVAQSVHDKDRKMGDRASQ